MKSTIGAGRGTLRVVVADIGGDCGECARH